MTEYAVRPEKFTIDDRENTLSTYKFGAGISEHHFCSKCGIYPFHRTTTQRGYYRINVGCLEGVDPFSIEVTLHNGAQD